VATSERSFPPVDFRTRLPALDGIRALAIILVFQLHYGGGIHSGNFLRVYKAITDRGWVGVDLFFVLSGFLITGILFDTHADSRFFTRFYLRRALRILPVFYMVMLLLALLTPILHYQWHWMELTYLVYIGNVFGTGHPMAHELSSTVYPNAFVEMGHFWSLCVEEQFYLLWPLVVWLVRDRIRLIWTAAGISLLALMLRVVMVFTLSPPVAEAWIDWNLPFRMDSLLIGAILALVLRGPSASQWQRSAKWIFLLGTAATVAVMMLSPAYDSPWLSTIGYTFIALASMGLVGTALRPGSASFRVFSWKPLRILGKYSYGFYIYHLLFRKLWNTLLAEMIVHFHSIVLAGMIERPLVFAVTFLVAKLSYDLVESRFLRLKRHFLYDSETAARQPAVATA
jgi:peptidoglycan/LPS O-acetylase OafA/YrhL